LTGQEERSRKMERRDYTKLKEKEKRPWDRRILSKGEVNHLSLKWTGGRWGGCRNRRKGWERKN